MLPRQHGCFHAGGSRYETLRGICDQSGMSFAPEIRYVLDGCWPTRGMKDLPMNLRCRAAVRMG